MQVGAALGNIRTAQPAGAKALYDGSVYEETAQFKMSLDEGFNVWYANIQNDPNEATYIQRFQEDRNSILESALEGVTLPEARSKAMEYAAGEFDKYFENVAKLAQEKKVKKIEATGAKYLDVLAQSGDVAGVEAAYDEQVAAGIVSASETQRVQEQVLPLARKQSAILDLSGLDYDAAIEATLEDGFGAKYGLDAAGVKAVRDSITDEKEQVKKLTAEKEKKSQDSVYKNFVQLSSDPATQPSRAQAVEMKLALIGHNAGYAEVDSYIKALDKKVEYDAAHKIETGRSQTYTHLATQLQNWDGNAASQPWNFSTLEKLAADEGAAGLDEGDFDKLKTDLEQKLKDIASGTGRGPNYKDPAKYSEFLTIINDDKRLPAQKQEEVKKFKDNGVPSPDYYAGLKTIDELNNRDDWRGLLGRLNNLYSPQLSALATTDTENRTRVATEWSEKTQALIKLFHLYPNAPDKWEAGLRSLLDPSIKKSAVDAVRNQIKGLIPGWRATEGEALEFAAEKMGPQFQANPALVAARSIEGENIRAEEEKVLAGLNYKIVDKYQDPITGFWLYSTVPIPRTANGLPIWTSDSLKGKVYEVKSEIVDKEYRMKAYVKALK